MKEIYASGKMVLVDDEDYEKLYRPGVYNWYIDNKGYVICWLPETKEFLRMHNVIMAYKGPDDIDHINRIKHDNRKENLRIVPHWVNLHNTKIRTDNTNGFKGVFLNASGNWGFQVWIKGKKFAKQGYKTPEEANERRNLFLKFKLEESGIVQ